MNTPVITGKSLWQYGFIAVPIAFAGFPLYVLAPDFYASHHGLSLTLLGTLLLWIRLLDALQDPVFGWLMDRLQGRFLPALTVASIFLCLSIFGLFNSSVLPPALWFSLCMLCAVSAYSLLTIALGIQATLWTGDPHEQTRIASAREAWGLVGLLIAVAMPTLLSHLVDADNVYRWYTAILVILMLTGLISFSRLALPVPIKIQRNASLASTLRALPKESLHLFLVYGVSMLASSIPAVLVIFYVRDLLGAEHLMGLFLFVYFVSGVVAMPLWKNLSVGFGKYKTWCLANIVAVIGFVSAFLLDTGDLLPYAAVCVITGFALGADLTLPPSILAGHIHARGSRDNAGMHYAFLVFIGKASLALASAVALPILDMAGFIPKAVNSEISLTILAASYALIPCALKLISAILLFGFFIRTHSGGNNENLQYHGNHRNSHHA